MCSSSGCSGLPHSLARRLRLRPPSDARGRARADGRRADRA
jgi:hypothetical protein